MSESVRTIEIGPEIRLVRTALLNKPLRGLILSEDVALLGYEPAKEVFEYLVRLAAAGRTISHRILEDDKSLSKEARIRVIRGTSHKPYRTQGEVKEAISRLEKWRKRRSIVEHVERTMDGLYDGEDEDDLIAGMERSVLEARSARASETMLSAGKGDREFSLDSTVLDIVDGRQPPQLKIGIPEFDTKTGGWTPGDLVLMMARRGAGKSSFALDLSVKQYLLYNKNVCCGNFEMTKRQYINRLLSNLTGIPHKKIRTNRLSPRERMVLKLTWLAFKKHGRENNCRYTVWTPGVSLTPDQVALTLAPQGYDVIFIDHLRKMNPSADDAQRATHDQIERASKRMKDLAVGAHKQCVVVLLAHMTDDWELKHARAVEDHCDFIFAWKLSRADKRAGKARIRQMKARDAEEYPFDVDIDLSCHHWDGPEDREQWSADEEDDFETDKISRTEQRESEGRRVSDDDDDKRKPKGKKKSEFKPPERKKQRKDDLGLDAL